MELTNNKSNNSAIKLIFICVLIYAISYVGRKAYDSNINEIMTFFGQEKSVVGLVGTFFFIAYAVGQVIHGLMCKYYNPRIIICVALFLTASINFIVALLPVNMFWVVKYLWLINGFSHATFWSVIILILSKYVANKYKRTSMVALLLPVPIGTFLAYGISALMSYLNNFKYSFILSASLLTLLGIIWLIRSKALFNACLEEKKILDAEIPSFDTQIKQVAKKTKSKIPTSFFVMFGVLAIVAIINNLVKDGINTWTPTMLKETYRLENWFSVLLTLTIPLFAVFGSYLSLSLIKKLKNYYALCGVLYLLATIIFVVLIFCLNINTWIITLICFILIVLFMSGVNYIVTCVFPMENSEIANSGMVAGLIDGFCYAGSAIASFALGKIAEIFTWETVMYFLLALTMFATVICFLSLIFQKRQKN